MIFSDTHCHIHDSEFFPGGGQAEYERALEAGVRRILVVGTSSRSSEEALEFSQGRSGVLACLGIHPHEAKKELKTIDQFIDWCRANTGEKFAAIGEIGLDYYYMHSPRDMQIALLEKQLDMARELDLPVSFHVRDGFSDFWPIFDNFSGVRGVLHSFTDNLANMEEGLKRDLFIGINGIATFAREGDGVSAAVPLEKIVLETDAPFLTPVPYRGKINEPAFVPSVASFIADLRSISLEELSEITEKNATTLFFTK